MGANKPKLTIVNKKHLTSEELRVRTENEKKLFEEAPSKQVAKPPTWLCSAAKKIYKELTSKQYEINLITDLDRDSLALYCDALAKVQQLNKDITEEGMIGADGKTNPKVALRQKYLTDVVNLAKEFALTPASRLRFTLAQRSKPVDKKEEEFNKMFGGI